MCIVNSLRVLFSLLLCQCLGGPLSRSAGTGRTWCDPTPLWLGYWCLVEAYVLTPTVRRLKSTLKPSEKCQSGTDQSNNMQNYSSTPCSSNNKFSSKLHQYSVLPLQHILGLQNRACIQYVLNSFPLSCEMACIFVALSSWVELGKTMEGNHPPVKPDHLNQRLEGNFKLLHLIGYGYELDVGPCNKGELASHGMTYGLWWQLQHQRGRINHQLSKASCFWIGKGRILLSCLDLRELASE